MNSFQKEVHNAKRNRVFSSKLGFFALFLNMSRYAKGDRSGQNLLSRLVFLNAIINKPIFENDVNRHNPVFPFYLLAFGVGPGVVTDGNFVEA